MSHPLPYLSVGRLKRDRTPLGRSSITKLRGKRHWHVIINIIDCGYNYKLVGDEQRGRSL